MIDVWDMETQEYIGVPVEELKPGMMVPHYDSGTDSITHGYVINVQDMGYSHEFIRIRLDTGKSFDVTFSQPFEVLTDLGQGQKWHNLQAMYLRPGMQVVQIFDAENPLATIVSAEIVREPKVNFYNPVISSGMFTLMGGPPVFVK